MKQCWSGGELAEFWTLSSAEKRFFRSAHTAGAIGPRRAAQVFPVGRPIPSLPQRGTVSRRRLRGRTARGAGVRLVRLSVERPQRQSGTASNFAPSSASDKLPMMTSSLSSAGSARKSLPQDQDPRHLRSAVLDWCREHFVEPPSSDRIDRIISAAVRSFETAFFAGPYMVSSQVQPGSGLTPCWLHPQQRSRW